MRRCHSCGAPLGSNARFCESCGTRVPVPVDPEEVPISQPQSGKKKLCCPECGGRSLSPIVESTNSGGTAFSVPIFRNLNFTTFQSSTTHRNYWMCQDCGHKFRNLQNLKEEMASFIKALKYIQIYIIAATIYLIVSRWLIPYCPRIMEDLLLDLWYWVIALVVLMIALYVYLRYKLYKMQEDKKHLERTCFRRER